MILDITLLVLDLRDTTTRLLAGSLFHLLCLDLDAQIILLGDADVLFIVFVDILVLAFAGRLAGGSLLDGRLGLARSSGDSRAMSTGNAGGNVLVGLADFGEVLGEGLAGGLVTKGIGCWKSVIYVGRRDVMRL